MACSAAVTSALHLPPLPLHAISKHPPEVEATPSSDRWMCPSARTEAVLLCTGNRTACAGTYDGSCKGAWGTSIGVKPYALLYEEVPRRERSRGR